MQHITSLRDTLAADGAGGKATSLGALLRAGFMVPDGFVVVGAAANVAQLQPEILDAFDTLGSPYVAVRSSAVNEDSNNAAWAGQLDTFLNVERSGLLEHVQRCMTSADSARAKAYAASKGIASGGVAVIVQAMVPSEVSGVAFSAHPVTGSQEHMVIEAGLGLGEAIVSGDITPDMYVIEAASGHVSESVITTQTKQLVRGAHGNEWQDIAPPASQPKLNTAQLNELTGTVRKLADFCGFPVDVEWAYAAGTLYVLQARPITTLGDMMTI